MSAIGRLKTFGPTKPAKLPFLLPSGWEDLTAVVTDFKKLFPGGQRVVVRGISAKAPSTHVTRFKAVRMAGAIADRLNVLVKTAMVLLLQKKIYVYAVAVILPAAARNNQAMPIASCLVTPYVTKTSTSRWTT
jgi:hypothetical protein